MLTAMVITIVIFAAIFPMKGTFIRDLMMGRYTLDPGRLIFQGLTTFMWSMSAANVILKHASIKRERRALIFNPLPDNLDVMDIPALQALYEKIRKHPEFAQRILLVRAARILAMWINTRDYERTTQLAKEENELDVYLSDSSFRANRLYIWAMPLLGFVGTVYGVSYGIGGFAEFLRGNVTAEGIKVQVGLITEGLAVAFYTTLLGLLTAGGAAFPSLGCERKEEALLGDIDGYIQDRILSRLPSVRKAEFPVEQILSIRESIDAIRETMKIPVDDLTTAIRDGFSRMPDPRNYERVFAGAIAEAAELVNKKYGEFQIRYEHRIGELGGALAGKMDAVSERFRDGATRLADQLEQRGKTIEDGLRAHVDAAAHAREEAIKTADHMRQAADHWRNEAAQFVARLQQASTDFSTQAARLVELGGRVDSVLKTTDALEHTLSRIGGADDFRQTLSDLRKHLAVSDEALARISRPRKIVLEESTK